MRNVVSLPVPKQIIYQYQSRAENNFNVVVSVLLYMLTISETGIVSAVSCMNYSVKWLRGFQSNLKRQEIIMISKQYRHSFQISDALFSPVKITSNSPFHCQFEFSTQF